MLPWYGAPAGCQRDQLRDGVFVAVAHHPFHARHGGQLLGRALRVAACDQDPRRRVLPVHAPYGLPHVFIAATVTVQVFSTTKSAVERSPFARGRPPPATIPAPRHPLAWPGIRNFGRRISPPCYLL